MPRPLQFGHAPSELALNSAGFTPLAFANAVADRVEDAGVGRRVGSARAADRGLVDDRHRRVRPRQAAVDQRALAGAGDAGDRDEHAERHVDRDVLEVVEPRVADRDRAARRPRLGAFSSCCSSRCWPVSRARRRRARRTCPRTRPPAVGPGAGAHVDDVVGDPRSPPGRARRRGPCCPCRAGAASSAFIRSTSWACRPIVGSSKT